MAAGQGRAAELRVFRSLRGKICDAKNLVPYSGPNKMRDCFCTINLDQEEVFRTQVVEKSLSPYFGEDFYFEIPRIFQCLSFYIYDKSVLQKDFRIGKVAIKKEDLCRYAGKEKWYLLQPVDSNSEVQGKVHLEFRLNELITDNGSVCQQLVVQWIPCLPSNPSWNIPWLKKLKPCWQHHLCNQTEEMTVDTPISGVRMRSEALNFASCLLKYIQEAEPEEGVGPDDLLRLLPTLHLWINEELLCLPNPTVHSFS